MTPEQIAHHEDIMAQRRMFVRWRQKPRRWLGPTALLCAALIAGVAAEFAIVCWVCNGIGNGRMW